MQKKIIALAVAALASSAAFAQTNVTVSGRLDANVINWSGNGERQTAVMDNGVTTSRLTFRGVEDLGNGLKATFVLEGGVKPGSVADLSFDRAANVGLSGSFGTVTLGVQSTLTDAWMAAYDVAGNFNARNVLKVKGNWATAKTDAISYLSPNFSGLTVGVAQVFGEQAVSANRTGVTQVGVNYANGPVVATYVYSRQDESDVNGSATDNSLGASYDFGVAKVAGVYVSNKDTGATSQTDKLWQLGVVAPVGAAGAVHVTYGKQANEGADNDVKFWSLAYTHSLSKRTTAYAGYGRLSNQDAVNARPNIAFTAANGTSYNGVVAGLVHNF